MVIPVQELINGDDADVLGVEMEFDIKPFEGWAHPIFEGIWARLTFAWLDTKYTDFVTIDKISTIVGQNVVVRRIPRTSRATSSSTRRNSRSSASWPGPSAASGAW